MKNIFEGRTKEWDNNDWQGRSKKQVEQNYKAIGYGCLGIIIALIIMSVISSFI